jgi:di/tricarboxylate transporter
LDNLKAKEIEMRGQGAIIFLIVFFAVLMASLAMPEIPPGQTLYGLLGIPETDYLILGVSATVLMMAVFNGVVYGVIVWLLFTFGTAFMKRKSPASPS